MNRNFVVRIIDLLSLQLQLRQLDISQVSQLTMQRASSPGPIFQRITRKLTESLNPTVLTLRDQTHLHASHAQSPGLPETHFDLQVVSSRFEGMSLLQRQRKVYDILSEEIAERVHALSMITRTPAEVVRLSAAADRQSSKTATQTHLSPDP